MDLEKSRNPLQIWQIAKINLRHNFVFYFMLAVIIIILTPVLFGISDLDITASAVPLEMFVSLIGIILITPIFSPEQNCEIEEVVDSKYVSSVSVNIIRIVYSIISLLMLVGLFAIFMLLCRCSISLLLVFGSIATAMFLGSLGMFTAALSNNIAVSYMIPLIYYMLNIAGGNRFGHFYLFSMMRGQYEQKIWLFGASVILLVLGVWIKWVLRKIR